MTTELKPCPFCEGEMEVGNHGWFGHADTDATCVIATEDFPPSDRKMWNTRPQPIVTTDGLVERLRAGAEELRDFKSGPPNRLGIADKYDEAADRIASLEMALTEIRKIVRHSVFAENVRIREIMDAVYPLDDKQ